MALWHNSLIPKETEWLYTPRSNKRQAVASLPPSYLITIIMKSTTKLFLTAIAYIIPTIILGYTWHLIFFKDLYDSLGGYNRAEPIIPLGFASMIVQGLIIAYLFPFYAKNNYSMGAAIKFSILMGLFLFSVSTLANRAKIQVSVIQSWLLIQIAFYLLQFGVAGLLIGLVTRRRMWCLNFCLLFNWHSALSYS
jgi:hypothetical protein